MSELIRLKQKYYLGQVFPLTQEYCTEMHTDLLVAMDKLEEITAWAMRAREALEAYGNVDNWERVIPTYSWEGPYIEPYDQAREVLELAPDMLERQKEGG